MVKRARPVRQEGPEFDCVLIHLKLSFYMFNSRCILGLRGYRKLGGGGHMSYFAPPMNPNTSGANVAPSTHFILIVFRLEFCFKTFMGVHGFP